jgi:GWxTD domain-containing protein
MKAGRMAAWCSLMILTQFAPARVFAQNSGPTSADAASRRDVHAEVSQTVPCFGVRQRQPEKQLEANAIAMLPDWDRLWLTEDVADLISREERCAFLKLLTDEERTQFVEQFWARRAPDPTSLDNAFKREYYERIAFADEQFATQIPGWKTDRGRIYVRFGPPDTIESHRPGDTVAGAAAVGVEKRPYPSELWHYNQLHEKAVNLEFVDAGGNGDYRLVMPPELTDELTFIPARDSGGATDGKAHEGAATITELRVGAQLEPSVQFKDLEAVVTAGLERHQVHFAPRIEFSKATDATTLARLVVRVPNELPGPSSNELPSPATFEVFGRISRPSGWIVETFEREISFDGQSNPAQNPPESSFEADLAPGAYHLAIVVKNVATGDVGTLREAIEVPSYETLQSAKSAH